MTRAPVSLFDEIHEAARSIDPFVKLRVALAGHELDVEVESEGLFAQLKPALEHLEVQNHGRPASLTIRAFNDKPPERFSASHWLPAQHAKSNQSAIAVDERGMMFIDAMTGIVSLYDAQSAEAGVWFGRDTRLPIWVAAAPFLRVLDAHYVRHGKVLCHGAAIAKNERALLMIGPGGAGKSTLSIRASHSGYDYLGDDYVLLDPAAGRIGSVHSVYRSGKLALADLATAPIANLRIQQEAEDMAEKSYILPDRQSVRLRAPLAAIVEPQRHLLDEPRLLRVSPLQAMKAAIPSVLSQMQGHEQSKVDLLALAFNAPCYQLHLSADHRKNIAALDSILAQTPS